MSPDYSGDIKKCLEASWWLTDDLEMVSWWTAKYRQLTGTEIKYASHKITARSQLPFFYVLTFKFTGKIKSNYRKVFFLTLS